MVGDEAILIPDSCSADQNTWENVSRVSGSENFFFVCRCYRYVDDILTAIPRQKTKDLLNRFNSISRYSLRSK